MGNVLRFILVLVLTCAFTYLVVQFESVTDGLGMATSAISWLFTKSDF
jgi:hypothetical protein